MSQPDPIVAPPVDRTALRQRLAALQSRLDDAYLHEQLDKPPLIRVELATIALKEVPRLLDELDAAHAQHWQRLRVPTLHQQEACLPSDGAPCVIWDEDDYSFGYFDAEAMTWWCAYRSARSISDYAGALFLVLTPPPTDAMEQTALIRRCRCGCGAVVAGIRDSPDHPAEQSPLYLMDAEGPWERVAGPVTMSRCRATGAVAGEGENDDD